MPIDINELRDYKGGDPDKWRKHQAARFKPVEWVDEVIAKDENGEMNKTNWITYART